MRNLLNHWRLRRGLRWEKHQPGARELGFDAKNIAYLIALFLLYGLAGSIDYADQQAAAAEQQSALATRREAALLACLNGGSPGLYTTDAAGRRHYIVCDRPFTVSDEGVERKRG